eukprot:gene21978-3507_t
MVEAVTVPRPIWFIAACAAISLIGDGSIYVVLPVVFSSRGLSPVQVGVVLSANRWTRLFTNGPAAHVLGVRPVRQVFGFALFVGGITSLVCGATTNFILLVAARCAWGGCWSIIRLTGMLAVTDCVEEGVAPESMVGTMTGTASGVTRLGSAVGMAAGGFLSNRIGFSNLFFLAAALSMAISPAAARLAFEDLPLVSKTAARKVEQQSQREGGQSSSSSQSQGSAALASRLCACAPPEMSRKQWQLFALAFAVSCAGNGLIVSTLGAVL